MISSRTITSEFGNSSLFRRERKTSGWCYLPLVWLIVIYTIFLLREAKLVGSSRWHMRTVAYADGGRCGRWCNYDIGEVFGYKHYVRCSGYGEKKKKLKWFYLKRRPNTVSLIRKFDYLVVLNAGGHIGFVTLLEDKLRASATEGNSFLLHL